MLFEVDEGKKEEAYRECYEKLHKFMLEHAVNQRDHIYPATIQRYARICKIIGSSKRVLEIGCGEGFLSMAIAKAGNDVIGTDISDTIILLARKNAEKRGVQHVIFKRMDGRKLQFPSNTFDWVISKYVLEHFHPEDVYTHLKEVKRVLKRGGCYFLITPNRYAGWTSRGLHLKIYTYTELNEIFGLTGNFVLRSPLFPPVSCLNFSMPICHKILLENGFHRYKIPNIMWLLMGLEPIMVMAYKSSHET